jgi:hypothetical protein
MMAFGPCSGLTKDLLRYPNALKSAPPELHRVGRLDWLDTNRSTIQYEPRRGFQEGVH